MSKSGSNNASNSTLTKTIPDEWEHIPCIQYGFPDDKGPTRAPKLRTIFESIPNDAETASPVYLLSREQYERQSDFESGYEVKGYTSIATELQDECEADDRVFYPVHIESDVYHEEGPATLIEWFCEFVEDYLGVPFHTCTLYFSGNRSIHVHVPRFVSGEDQRERLKELAEMFCTDNGAELDCGLYYAKRLFRLPSVEHANTGLRKVEIKPDWGRDRIFRETNEATPVIPESYEAVLRNVFTTHRSLTVDSQTTLDPPYDLFRVLNSEKTVLEFKSDERDIGTPLIEQEQYPNNPADTIKWLQYNAKEFSPYALAKGDSRSVAVLEVKGSPFSRKEVTGGSYGRPVYVLIPAFFYGARGCAGEEFIKDHEHAPLQLSKTDYTKWTYQPGDHVVIIGGKSGSSIIFQASSQQASDLGLILTGEDGCRQDALHYLENEGYNTGKSGSSVKAPTLKRKRKFRRSETSQWKQNTESAKLQHQAEHDGIETLSHIELSNVANRLLTIGGWSLAWGWCETQFGDQFDLEVTWKHLKGIVEYYDIPAVVPPKPR
ncbi:hypothetical protein NDI54_08615 [Haloarcula sp. S1AR25-5A]|uniref:DNA primase small subunit n=1 Tax=Haloarcula terrestris TaxID=2950533 RepID=A0AAE4EXW4_9EURY|nr:hypothetical protein [Haloarcula terrestris]MDS0221409.1 hypothetical protein [Haloarcula terrestris]